MLHFYELKDTMPNKYFLLSCLVTCSANSMMLITNQAGTNCHLELRRNIQNTQKQLRCTPRPEVGITLQPGAEIQLPEVTDFTVHVFWGQKVLKNKTNRPFLAVERDPEKIQEWREVGPSQHPSLGPTSIAVRPEAITFREGQEYVKLPDKKLVALDSFALWEQRQKFEETYPFRRTENAIIRLAQELGYEHSISEQFKIPKGQRVHIDIQQDKNGLVLQNKLLQQRQQRTETHKKYALFGMSLCCGSTTTALP